MVDQSREAVEHGINVLTECLARVQAVRPELIETLPAGRDRIIKDLSA